LEQQQSIKRTKLLTSSDNKNKNYQQNNNNSNNVSIDDSTNTVTTPKSHESSNKNGRDIKLGDNISLPPQIDLSCEEDIDDSLPNVKKPLIKSIKTCYFIFLIIALLFY
jgi:hypothetical protein